MNLSWMLRVYTNTNEITTDNLSFNIYRNDELIASEIKENHYIDSGLEQGKYYCYIVKSNLNNAISTASNEVCGFISENRNNVPSKLTVMIKKLLFLLALTMGLTLQARNIIYADNIKSLQTIGWVCPYVDPGIAIAIAVILAKEPVEMITESIRNLILFAPKQEIMDQIDAVVHEKLISRNIMPENIKAFLYTSVRNA